MTYVFFWIAAACCLVAQIAILRSILTAEPATQADDGVPCPPRSVELLWVTIPAMILALVLALTWQAIRDQRSHSTQHAARSMHVSSFRSS